MAMSSSSLLRLHCGVNSYDWGKKGKKSCAARYAAASSGEGFQINEDHPYAELWMGTHPSNPSKDATTGKPLLDIIEANKSLVSDAVAGKFGCDIPFLFKILSIEKALSIQAHPNKGLAKQLHLRDPSNYPDENHKPEMAIAITPFEALCGFRPLYEVQHFLQHVPALRDLVGEDILNAFALVAQKAGQAVPPAPAEDGRKALKMVLGKIMQASKSHLESAARDLINDAQISGSTFASHGVASTRGDILSELVLRLHSQYGPDHGLFVLFLMNFVKLSPGEALYLQADDVHAYISGDIVECMATSDNVVRAGLTTRYKDVSTLVDMLTYNHGAIEQQKMKPETYIGCKLSAVAEENKSTVKAYDPPIEEFAVSRCLLMGMGATATYSPVNGPSILICLGGRGTIRAGPVVMNVEEGQIFFIGAGEACILESRDGTEQFETYRAFCEAKLDN